MGRGEKVSADNLAVTKFMAKAGKRATDIYRADPTLGTQQAIKRLVTKIKADPEYAGAKKVYRRKTARTAANVKKVREEILKSRKSVTNSARKLASKLHMKKTSTSAILKEDLNLKSRRPFKTFRMSEKQKEKRRKWAVKMEKALKGEPSEYGAIDAGRIWFSDEKLFSIKTKGSNSQNNRAWAFGEGDPALRVQEHDAFSKGVMVSLAVSKCGIGRVIFVAEAEKICGASYKKTLPQEFFPDVKMKMAAHSEPNTWWWQQDLAPSHGEATVKKVLEGKKIVPNVLPWPPKGADLSVLDFAIWGYFDSKLAEYREQTQITSEADLRTALLTTHSTTPQEFVDKSVGSFVKRVSMLKEAHGGHFEHMAKKTSKKANESEKN